MTREPVGHTVGDVAKATGLTVRTLRHYDEVGLLVPTRSAAGYRVYTDEDVEKLHRICTYRELGFSLDDIGELLSDPDVDLSDHLRRQHEELVRRIAHLEDVKATIETLIEAEAMNISLTPEEKFEVFGDQYAGEYDSEAERRWGESDAYKESNRRTRSYKKSDWLLIQQEANAIEEQLATQLRAGVSPQSRDAAAGAEAHRLHIDRWFYPCSREMHRRLAAMYTEEARFSEHYERREPGLAAYIRAAIDANAEADGG